MYAMMVASFIRIFLLAGALHAITAASIPKALSSSNDNSSATTQTQITIRNGSRTAASAALLVHKRTNFVPLLTSLIQAGSHSLEPCTWLPVPLSALEYRLGPVVKGFYCQHGKHAVNLGQNLLRPHSIFLASFLWPAVC
jgi:hypothetical protein